MEFRLPTQLQNELLPYDPALKALARQNRTTKTTKKSKYPLGRPENLIPDNIVRQHAVDEAIERINASAAPDRYHRFLSVRNVATEDAETETIAILYHYEQVWYAAWFPPVGKESEYVYGFSFAYKDTAAARKSLPAFIRNRLEELTSVQYGKSFFWTYSKLVTKKDILNGLVDEGWNIPHVASYYQKSRDMAVHVKAFREQLVKSIPNWKDGSSIFDRLCSQNIGNILLLKSSSEVDPRLKDHLKDPSWKPSYQEFQYLILEHGKSSGYCGEKYRDLNKILHIIDTPYFRKLIQSKCDESVQLFENPDTDTMRSVIRPWRQLHSMFDTIAVVHSIWPDCPIDYYQNHTTELLCVDISRLGYRSTPTKEWLAEHMPVASFFGLLSKFYEKSMQEVDKRLNGYMYSVDLGVSFFTFNSFLDTMNMISTLLDKGHPVPVPKRWRIDEFHDTIQAEAWKVKNPNEMLPQDLFPEPIKLTHDEVSWSFFQPHDTHQLALWGQAVRNCVGSASNYAEGVRKKKHFLVLCMVGGKPMFTVQLDVNMGMMSVRQIVGTSNSRLSDVEKELYTKAFAQALKLREEQLTQQD